MVRFLATIDLDSVQLEAESQEFGDLVQDNFLDTYRLVDFSFHCFVFVLSHQINNKKTFWTQVSQISYSLFGFVFVYVLSHNTTMKTRQRNFLDTQKPFGKYNREHRNLTFKNVMKQEFDNNVIISRLHCYVFCICLLQIS